MEIYSLALMIPAVFALWVIGRYNGYKDGKSAGYKDGFAAGAESERNKMIKSAHKKAPKTHKNTKKESEMSWVG